MTGCPFYFICLVCTRQIGETPGESATRKCSAKLHFHFALRCKAASAHASGLLTQTPALPDFPAKLSTGQIFSPRPALRFALNRSVPSRHAPGRFRDCGRGQRLLASGLSRPFEKGRRKLLIFYSCGGIKLVTTSIPRFRTGSVVSSRAARASSVSSNEVGTS